MDNSTTSTNSSNQTSDANISAVTQRFILCHDKLKQEGIIRSSRQFAITLDYLPQSLSEILKHRRDVTIELLRKAVEVYKINPLYVFTGEGEMFLKAEEKNQDSRNFRVLTVVTDVQNDECIVHVPIPAQAGYASESCDTTFIQQLPTYTLPDYKYKVGTHRSFDVSGDSMEPTLFEGDKVVCSYLEPTLWNTAIKDNYVYIIVTHGDILVKRVYNKLKESNTLLLSSDNSFYEPYTVHVQEIKEIWYVRAKISPFLPSPQSIKHLVKQEVDVLRETLLEQTNLINTMKSKIDNLIDNK